MAKQPAIDAEAYRLMREGRIDEALVLAERAVMGSTTCVPGHGFLASLLLKLGRIGDADQVVARAARLSAGSAEAYDGLAYVSVELHQHEWANELYRRAVGLEPDRAQTWYNLACSERSFGRLDAAEEACDRSIALDARHHPSVLLRSELRVQSPQSNHISDLEHRLVDPRMDVNGRIFAGYALAKELDDVGRFDDAFAWFARAARERRSQIDYDVGADERRMKRLAEVYPRAVESGQRDGRAIAASRDLFVVGLPRSGTTLVERILTGLPGVRSNGETENFARALSTAAALAPSRGDVVDRASRADPSRVAALYAQRAHVGGTGAAILEKLPTNYLYVGAILRALPAAKVILLRRAPLDSCFAMYRALFGAAYPFTYDFDELARYYVAYDSLMTHWLSGFGAAIHEVVYEDLVLNPMPTGSALAQACGLAWNPQAADITGNHSVSLTASAAQIRRPIYGTSSGRWRHYRQHLQPLIDALRRRGVALPADA